MVGRFIKGVLGKFLGVCAAGYMTLLVPWMAPFMFAWTIFLIVRAVRGGHKASQLKVDWGLSMFGLLALGLVIRVTVGS